MFLDRDDAGRKVGAALQCYGGLSDVIVLALPRGGVPVGYRVAEALRAPFDVFVVRKLGVPGQPELAMGAVASGGVRVLNQEVVRQLDIPAYMIDRVTAEEQQELERREMLYRGNRPAPLLAGKIVVLVDDGLATGSTMRAGAQAVRLQNPKRVVVGVPVAAALTCRELRGQVDEVVCVTTPEPFFAVGQWYENFDQTSDDEVRELLQRASGLADPIAS
jgi:putative phosphoribosyl transferase